MDHNARDSTKHQENDEAAANKSIEHDREGSINRSAKATLIPDKGNRESEDESEQRRYGEYACLGANGPKKKGKEHSAFATARGR